MKEVIDEKRLLKEIVRTIKDFLDPDRILLFGSRAKGIADKYSDFDIAIEGAGMDIRTERKIKELLDDKLKAYTVEIINLDKVDPAFKEMVLKTGRILYERGSKVLT